MSDRLYPIDIHGCAQGIITFSLRAAARRHRGRDLGAGSWTGRSPTCGTRRPGGSTTSAAGDSGHVSGSCAGARAGCPGRWPATSRTAEINREAAFPAASCRSIPAAASSSACTPGCSARPANGLRIRLRRVLPVTEGSYRTILDAGCGSGVFSYELAKRHPEAPGHRRGRRCRPGRPGQRDRQARRAWPTAVPAGRRHQARLRGGSSTWSSASTTSSTSRTTSGPCARCCTRCARAGAWSCPRPGLRAPLDPAAAAGSTSTCPATSGPATGPSELVGKLQRGRVRGQRPPVHLRGRSRPSPTTSPT